MSKLPEKFPEYSIMHKTLSKKIIELEKVKENTQKGEMHEIQLKIQNYQNELNKIRKMFPDGFFDD
jgi:DNA-binding protein H-NS